MGKVIDKVNSPKDIKKLNIGELSTLCDEVRVFLIENVSKTGGHIASNLGVVELTTSLFWTFDIERDKIVYDVGHQSYVHKIYTGRKDRFSLLRKKDGLSGFPKVEESKYDCFNTGHSSTSVSAALGLARARDLNGTDERIIALIGDGALTGGLSFEGLNDMGRTETNVIVVLNDNNMSVFKNVGGMSKYLNRIRADKEYFKFKYRVENTLDHIPVFGDFFVKLAKGIKDGIKKTILPTTYFEELGFTYIGPVDGHNLDELNKIFDKVKNIEGPVLVHVITKKGKGYLHAENKPHKFHGISKFDIETGGVISKKYKADYSYIFGRKLIDIAKENKKLVCISPAMPLGSGLSRFMRAFPARFFDVGIAEGHAVTMAAGMARGGMVPVCAIYSSFLQRAYDSIIHDVANQNLHIVFAIDRAGAVGEDGDSHQGVYDISYMYHVPNMSMLAPANFYELQNMLEYAVNVHKSPIAIRYPRGNRQVSLPKTPFVFGKSDVIQNGDSVTILACGSMVINAVSVAKMLKEKGINAEVINLKTIKPLDEETILASVRKTKFAVTIEDGALYGGVGSVISGLILSSEISGIKFKSFGFTDKPILQATILEQYADFGIDEESIYKYILGEISAKEGNDQL